MLHADGGGFMAQLRRILWRDGGACGNVSRDFSNWSQGAFTCGCGTDVGQKSDCRGLPFLRRGVGAGTEVCMGVP